MRHLVLAHGNEVAFINEDVCGLQHRVSKKSVGTQIFFGDVIALFLVGGDTFEPSQRRDHRKQQMQFGMLRHMRLDEHGAALGIEPGGKPIEQDFYGILLYLRSIGVVGGERVPVGDKKEALILVLHAYPVIECAHEIAQVQLPGRAHPAEDAFLCLRRHHAFNTSKNMPSTGSTSLLKRLGAK